MAEGVNVFSLEDDDYNELFITQVPKDNVDVNKCNDEESGDMFFGVAKDDFQSPCSSLINRNEPTIYSDISDADVFQMDSMPSDDR